MQRFFLAVISFCELVWQAGGEPGLVVLNVRDKVKDEVLLCGRGEILLLQLNKLLKPVLDQTVCLKLMRTTSWRSDVECLVLLIRGSAVTCRCRDVSQGIPVCVCVCVCQQRHPFVPLWR